MGAQQTPGTPSGRFVAGPSRRVTLDLEALRASSDLRSVHEVPASPKDVWLVIVESLCVVDTEAVEDFAARNWLVSGDGPSLLAFDQAYPEEHLRAPLVALNASAGRSADAYVLTLTTLHGQRVVLRARHKGDWAAGTRFLMREKRGPEFDSLEPSVLALEPDGGSSDLDAALNRGRFDYTIARYGCSFSKFSFSTVVFGEPINDAVADEMMRIRDAYHYRNIFVVFMPGPEPHAPAGVPFFLDPLDVTPLYDALDARVARSYDKLLVLLRPAFPG